MTLTKPDQATARWIKTAADEKAAANGCYFDEAAADHVVQFFLRLRHTIGEWAGQPIELMDWQRDDFIKPLFGWMNPEGQRRFRIAYVEIPKKNGKSTICSGLSLYLLAADGEAGAQVYCAASDRIQAGIVYNEASRMAQESALLKRYVKPRDSQKNLSIPSQNSFLRAISSDAYRNEGLNPHGIIFDELHAQPNRELWDCLRYGGASRRQPLLIAITTAGYDRNSICYEQHKRARKVLDGQSDDDTFFAYIRAADGDDDWTKEETWRKANPSYGVTIDASQFAADCLEAQESPTQENTFKRYRLNIWTQQATRWMPMHKWDECDGSVDIDELEGQRCFAGLDLSSTTDISALVLLFPDHDNAVIPFFWVPEESAHERSKRDRVPYLTWERQGLIELTPGNSVDYRHIRSKILDVDKRFQLEEIAFDPWNASHLATQLGEEDGIEMVKFRQGFASMNEPMKQLMSMVLARDLSHGANPALRWMADNVTATGDPAGNIKPDKGRSTEKIDGIVALIMAVGRAMVAVAKPESIYRSEGLFQI